MHPAASVILFTTASGAGLGLLAWLALLGVLGLAPATTGFGFVGLGLAVALLSLGLLSSTLHLGRPERALRALTQWRSSWLAREGVAALATYVAAGPFALGWIVLNRVDGPFAVAAVACLALAAFTVVCTAMIYASLKPIRQWSQPLTLPLYLLMAAASGALLLADLTLAFGAFRPAFGALAAASLALTGLAKLAYWRAIDREPPRSTLASATGLSAFGAVRLLEPPHTEENFVMREMGFRVARKHAVKLRRFVVAALFVAPVLLMLLASVAPPLAALAAALAATLLAAAGLGVERWLFFAEATHVSMLYYGRPA
ncbi:MAG TPA: DmsC/YnfH family molybdoenzyme membrane anchor subunit [Roseiarcus sp.]|nr:DmsC/YnfH family molybdoenzyme membrane anchor subunit [Roseiarcus sp.]